MRRDYSVACFVRLYGLFSCFFQFIKEKIEKEETVITSRFSIRIWSITSRKNNIGPAKIILGYYKLT